MSNKKQLNYVMREGEKVTSFKNSTHTNFIESLVLISFFFFFKDSVQTYPLNYRVNQLDVLRKKASEEERIDEINKQIYNLQNLKNVIQTK